MFCGNAWPPRIEPQNYYSICVYMCVSLSLSPPLLSIIPDPVLSGPVFSGPVLSGPVLSGPVLCGHILPERFGRWCVQEAGLSKCRGCVPSGSWNVDFGPPRLRDMIENITFLGTKYGIGKYAVWMIKKWHVDLKCRHGSILCAQIPTKAYLYTLQEHHKFLTKTTISIISDPLKSMGRIFLGILCWKICKYLRHVSIHFKNYYIVWKDCVVGFCTK